MANITSCHESTASPSTVSTRSPGSRPASCPGEPGSTMPTTGGTSLASRAANPVMNTIDTRTTASTTLANGPARRIRTRCQRGPVEVLAGIVAALAGVLPGEVDVAAQRNPRHPVLGLAAAKRQQLAPEAEREGEHPDAEALGHQVVAELVDEDDDAEREEEGERVAEELHGGWRRGRRVLRAWFLPRPPHAALGAEDGAAPVRKSRHS